MTKKRHKLSRHIPNEVKKIVQKNSKYACIVPSCRNIIYEYEHLIPEFKDALVHDPDKICLTCPTHNPRKTGNQGEELYSKEQLIEFYKKIKESSDSLDISNKDLFSGFDKNISIKLGSLKCRDITSLIEINGNNIFSFTKNTEEQIFAPDILFNGKFEKPNGECLFEIVDNEWKSNSDHGDVIYKNGCLKIYDHNQTLIFSLKKIPSQNLLVIEDLDLWAYPFHIYIKNEELVVARHDVRSNSYIGARIDADISHQQSTIKLSSKGLDRNIDFTGRISYSGDTGFELGNNGIKIAFGDGISRISKIDILTAINRIESGRKFINVEDMIKKRGG